MRSRWSGRHYAQRNEQRAPKPLFMLICLPVTHLSNLGLDSLKEQCVPRHSSFPDGGHVSLQCECYKKGSYHASPCPTFILALRALLRHLEKGRSALSRETHRLREVDLAGCKQVFRPSPALTVLMAPCSPTLAEGLPTHADTIQFDSTTLCNRWHAAQLQRMHGIPTPAE